MNAIAIHLYEFPVEFVQLVHLKYLSLTCNGKLPTSISNLWKLQYLIVKRYMNVKSSRNSGPLPVEIWDMKELKHLHIMGGHLPNHQYGIGLLKLSTLLDVSAENCREGVIKWIPNLQRLGIRIELVPTDADADADEGSSFIYLNNIHHLDRLESLKIVVMNPQITSAASPRLAPLWMLPQSLKKLSLSGLGYPWEHMSIIGNLRNLEMLKLKSYAFQEPIWEMNYMGPFMKLKFLLIEDTNLVRWKATSLIGMNLEYMCIKHCYKLQELPVALRVVVGRIEIVDCHSLTVNWAEQVGQTFSTSKVSVHHSWFDNTKQE